MGGSKGWPSVGKTDPSYLEHASLIKTEIEAIRNHANPPHEKHAGHQIPFATANKLFDSILQFIKRAQEQPDMRNVARQIQEIHVSVTKAARTPSTTTSTSNSQRSYASVVSNPAHLLPPSIVSRASATSTRPPIASPAQREIIIKLNDPQLAQAYRRGHSENPQKEILTRLNDTLSQESLAVINKLRLASAQSLKSGDIQVYAATARDAELLKKHTAWAKALGSRAEIQQPSFGVVLHSVPVKSMNMEATVEAKERVAGQLRSENVAIIGDATIRHVSWLTPPPKEKRVAAAVIEFDSAVDANAAIAAQTLAWNGSQCRTEKYNRSCRLRQCFKCYQYGHIGTTCPNAETCGMCGAKDHLTKACHVPVDKRQCCLCQGKHTPWAAACPIRQKEKARLKDVWIELKKEPFWPEVSAPYISPGPSQISSNPSTQQQAQSAPQEAQQQSPEDPLPFQTVTAKAKRRRQSSGQAGRSKSPAGVNEQTRQKSRGRPAQKTKRPLAESSGNSSKSGKASTIAIHCDENPDELPIAVPEIGVPQGKFDYFHPIDQSDEENNNEIDVVMGGEEDADEGSNLSSKSRKSGRARKQSAKATQQ